MPASPVDRPRRLRLPLPLGTLIGFALAVAAVAAMGVVSSITSQRRMEAAGRLTDTLEVIEHLALVESTVKDIETSQRGFLLTKEDAYLEPYNNASASLPALLTRLQTMVASTPDQADRARTLERFASDAQQAAAEAIRLERAGNSDAALALMRTDRGKIAMDAVRDLVAEMSAAERDRQAQREAAWQDSRRLADLVSWGGSALLIMLFGFAAVSMSNDFRMRERTAWVRAGQAGLAARLQGETRLAVIGEQALDFLAHYLNAQVGALYIVDEAGTFERAAGFALPAGAGAAEVRSGEGLVGQVVRNAKVLHVTDVPDGYLPVSSATGRRSPTELVIAPAVAENRLKAVVELGFFRAVDPAVLELLEAASENLGVAVRSAKQHARLTALLEETQSQAEELQTQQEELRVSNEELEEQSRALKESQARLEQQQAELEQINSNLEEQTQLLESQKDDLSTAQSTLRAKANELERANQYKSEFLANMSHELRTPLNSSLILATLLADNKDGNLTEEQVKFARTIYEAGNDLLALINDILDLSKIEAGRVDLVIAPVMVTSVLDSLRKTFEPIAAQKGLEFRIDVAGDVPDQFASDAQRLGQILKNLLSNAIKFTDRGSVTLAVATGTAGTLRFAVTDTGIGIPPHQQDIVFEAFRQADGSTHRKYGGTGLGLSISRDLAHLLGGDLSLVSEPGEGSTFTLLLPVSAPERPAAAAPTPFVATGAPTSAARKPAPERAAAAPARGPVRPAVADDRATLAPNARRILIIEDDQAFASILRDLSREKGFQCVVAHTAQDGVAAAIAHMPHAILLDINLPDHSGLGVLDQLKRNPRTRHIPVHVLSVADYSQQALERGAIGYVVKPVNRDQLMEAFSRLEAKLTQDIRRVLIVEDDERQRASLSQLLAADGVEIVGAASAAEARAQLRAKTFDCVVMDLKLPDENGSDLLDELAAQDDMSFPPVIIYTGRSLTTDEEQRLRRVSKSIIIKDARSPERLLDEVTLFLHQVEASLPAEHQRMLQAARDRDTALDGRRVLVVEDDARNIFALSRILEPRGVRVSVARNGREALEALDRAWAEPGHEVDLVLMDVMMPEMDGLTAIREIRRKSEWRSLPIIALTAKAMKDDHERCLSAGANDYMAKPFDVDQLLSLVRVWMPK